MVHNKPYLRILLLTAVALLCMVAGCDEPVTPVEDKSFVRLLENQKMRSEIFKVDINYAVLLPEGYETSNDIYPVVYLLHGLGDNEKAWYANLNIKYYVDLYKDEITPMIYVMPIGYNTYWANRYTGNYPYMDMITTELVPTIDKLFRTNADPSARAAMGYSMGGYGALILPALNPDIFTISVPLSMSFRTDEQYKEEPQSVFDYQWGPIFGGSGLSGEARLTDYFKEHSPFHFFDSPTAQSRFSSLKILLDCGDDEESLSETNDNLHTLMRDRQIPHEYRVRNGGHTTDYWKKSIPEALKFISEGVQGIPYPTESIPVDIGTRIASSDYETIEVAGQSLRVLKPEGYASSANEYPTIYFIHDVGNSQANLIDVFSLFRNAMTSSKIPNAIVVEIPASEEVDSEQMNQIIQGIESQLRAKPNRMSRTIIGNSLGGKNASEIVSENSNLFNSCFLMCAQLPDEALNPGAVFYYLDITDDGNAYKGYNNLYLKLREQEIGYEYRVRQGTESYQSFLNGLYNSFSYLKGRLAL